MSGVVGGHGKNVCIQHTGTLSTCYAHNSRLRVREGESVDSGDVISRSGCTGRCYGDHLHSRCETGAGRSTRGSTSDRSSLVALCREGCPNTYL
jgi:Membrane proteins related to metalloendopeptidases